MKSLKRLDKVVTVFQLPMQDNLLSESDAREVLKGLVTMHLPGKHDQDSHGGVLYHGTTLSALKNILKNGLEPGHANKSALVVDVRRKTNVFLTDDEWIAQEYAESKALSTVGGKVPVVLKVRVRDTNDLAVDDREIRSSMMKKVPPEDILGYWIGEEKRGKPWTGKRTGFFKFVKFIKVNKANTEDGAFVLMLIDSTADARETLKGLVTMHLPGKHNQQDHGRHGEHSYYFEKPVGAANFAKQFGGTVSKITKDVHEVVPNQNTKSKLTDAPHIKRETVGLEKVTRKMRDGSVKEFSVPVYKYTDSTTGKVITDRAQIDAILSRIKVAPGVGNVRIAKDPKSALVATWSDTKGRTVYRYSKKHDSKSSVQKFDRLKVLFTKIPKLDADIQKGMLSKDKETRDTASALYLISRTGLRVGNETTHRRAAVHAYGATTLLDKHVKVSGDTVNFDFIGKKGIQIKKSVKDQTLAKMMTDRLKNKGEKLFELTSDKKARSFIKQSVGAKFKVHDLRTLHGTAKAVELINAHAQKEPFKTLKEFKAAQKEISTAVSAELGNTPSMALKSYIAPQVWSKWRQASWGEWSIDSDKRKKK